jgi:hypothetical protein
VLFGPDEHAANAPDTWKVIRVGRNWAITTKDEIGRLDTCATKRTAIERTKSGFLVDLYEKERRWYAGEQVAGWKPYKTLTEAKEGRA